MYLEHLHERNQAGVALVQNADGDVTEANFGNDDETLGRLEDMGISGVEGVEADVSRQNSGSAQRRRQVGMHHS